MDSEAQQREEEGTEYVIHVILSELQDKVGKERRNKERKKKSNETKIALCRFILHPPAKRWHLFSQM